MAKRKTFTRNFGLKGTALILAVLLELYFYSPDNSVRITIPVQIEIRNIPSSVMIVDPPRAEKGMLGQVEIRGPGPLVHQVQRENNRFTVYLPPDIPPLYTATLNEAQLNIPSGVEVISVSPSSVTLRTEAVAVKELLIVPEHNGKPGEGFEIEEISVFPSSVVVRGPRSRVEGLRAVQTDPVDVANLTESIRKEVILREQDALVALGVNMVWADVKVAPVRVDKTFDNVTVSVLSPEGYTASVEPSKVSVTVKAPVQTADTVRFEEIRVTADARELSSGHHRLSLGAILPKDVTLQRTNPEKVKVSLVNKDG